MDDREFNSRFNDLERRLQDTDKRLTKVQDLVEDIKVIIDQGKHFFKFLGLIGAATKWFVGIGASMAGLWAAFKSFW